jgi:hypothetical protein
MPFLKDYMVMFRLLEFQRILDVIERYMILGLFLEKGHTSSDYHANISRWFLCRLKCLLGNAGYLLGVS